MAASTPSLRWLYLAVLGPLILLAVLAWWGTQSQLKAAWTEAREDAEQLAPGLAKQVSNELNRRIVSIPLYPDPPVPGQRSSADGLLDSTDIGILQKLAADPEAGLSPAGFPRQVLAALRIEELAPGTMDPDVLANLLIDKLPSALTSPALKRFPASPEAIEEWKQAEQTRSHAKTLSPGEERWLRNDPLPRERGEESTISYIRINNDHVEHLPPDAISDTLLSAEIPRRYWVEIKLPDDLEEVSPTHLVQVPLPGPGKEAAISINIGRGMVEGPIRRQQKWVAYLLAAALLTAGASLIIIHRTVARERHLADLKSQFVASVSHELRAPLGSIRLMAEALQQEKVSKPAEFHTLIAREGARLSHLIENVLDFARIEEGRKYYHFEECDLTALLRDTLRLMQPIAIDRGVHLTFDLPEITATIDPAAIQQALVNLLDNAIKFTPPKSTVNLQISAIPDHSVQITITDHGPGIPKSEQRSIFKRFHRLGNELRRETQGTGIGLSIVKHIAEAHEGTITVESTPPEGSKFILTLPDHSCESSL